MFEWLTTYFSGTKKRHGTLGTVHDKSIAQPLEKKIADKQDNPPNGNAASTDVPPTQPPSKKQQNSYVYIWLKTLNGPGHAAIQIGGSEPKLNAGDEGDYGSIHPQNLPSMGPLAVLPLKADMAESLTQDMLLEASADQKMVTNDMDTPPFFTQEERMPKQPDLTFEIDHLDTNAMHQRLQQLKADIAEGRMRYQLLPRVDVARFFQDTPHFIAYDPIDIHLQMVKQRQLPAPPSKVTNCSTLVADVLNAGGASIQTNKPWGITPDSLADALQHSGAKLN
ncbi:hypothetical protein DIZ81_12430 [Legionella taurinensis]|uniref:Uncharacterized protein n=1 Tax=Legionella taurinensis TaxID=70611 RepID=A0AB38N7E6_9GAMM|nr:hypothetical protein [Legionella taurinensis]MDX1838651.1 hypothetical protein [Legionella taurinensis]PUT38840.1 hypothetical protein DB744_12795 [Legionella taurinensis]PUT40162.1 hypothetical protein DB746_11840 [Legionella taurinensis]PUT42468.1 hypothetical protein DB743_12325 [Legionella taurinensis]PUT45888.1 hypothetical protein DB745_12235 [Legionella taurinensis]